MGKAQSSVKLHNSKRQKNDEWYTQEKDIVAELQYYTEQFKGKVVYCPCDDATWSNFAKYFKENFKSLGLKKVICSCFYPRKNDLYSALENVENEKGYWCEYNGDDFGDYVRHEFKESDGDFRSHECLELLKQCDIVVTNPPFSLFRQFFDWIMSEKKQFLVICNHLTPCYKNVFGYIKDREVVFGYNSAFSLQCYNRAGELLPVVPCSWLTNIVADREPPPFLELTAEYDPSKYKMLANYDALNIYKLKEIPKDYFGEMAVPANFLKKWNPQQFEITGSAHWSKMRPLKIKVLFGSEKDKVINFNARGIYEPAEDGGYLDMNTGARYRSVFNRIFIKRIT